MIAYIRAGTPPGLRKAERPTLPGRPFEFICWAKSIPEKIATHKVHWWSYAKRRRARWNRQARCLEEAGS